MKNWTKTIKRNAVAYGFYGFIALYVGYMLTTGRCPSCLVGDLLKSNSNFSVDVEESLLENPTSASYGLYKRPFSWPTVSGGVITSNQLEGKGLVINYWASWCGPCVREIPGFSRTAVERAESWNFVGISLDRDSSALQRFLQKKPLDYPVIQGPVGLMQTVGEIRSIPTTLFFDREGKLFGRHVGYLSESRLNKILDSI